MVLRLLYIVCLFVFKDILSGVEANGRVSKIISKAEDVKQSFKQSENIKQTVDVKQTKDIN